MRVRLALVLSVLVVLVLAVAPLEATGVRPAPAWPVRSAPILESTIMAGGTWAYTWGGGGAEDAWLVRQTTGGGYVLGGTTGSVGGSDMWLMEVAAGGTTTWQKTYGTPGAEHGDVMPTADGGYLLAGVTDDTTSWLCKLNGSGVIQWQNQYASGDSNFSTLFALSDGTFIATGNEMSFQPMSFTLHVARIGAGGQVLWAKDFASGHTRAGLVYEQPDGTLMFAGTRMELGTGSTDIWLMKLNTATGALVWEKILATAGQETSAQLYRLADGGHILMGAVATGTGGSMVSDALVVRLDANANILWQKTIGGPLNDLVALYAAVDGGWVLCGATHSYGAGDADIWIVKVSETGNILWQKTYGGPAMDGGGLIPDGTGGYFLVGHTESFGGGKSDLWLLRLDSLGNITWQRTYGGANDEDGMPTRLPDGSVLVVGTTDSHGSGADDVFVIKADTNGAVSGSCPFIRTTSVTPQATNAVPVTTALTVSPGTSVASDGAVTVTAATLVVASASLGRKELCGATPTLTATASATPTSGAAPLAVSFTGAASNGVPPYTFDWSFADGTEHSTEQSPSHTYAFAGNFNATLTVRDAAGATATDSHLMITVTGGGGCVVTCAPSVPTSGTPGTPITFQANVTATGCAIAPTTLWSFGDDQISTQPSTTHTYAAAGTYTWSLMASSASGGTPCVKSGTITIGAGTQNLYMIPSVGHLPGKGGTQWRTNIAAVNRSGVLANLILSFYPYAEGTAPIVRNATLANGATTEWQDVVVSLFNLSAATSNKGTVHISSDRPIFATSRTYNQAAAGTYGQYYPALQIGHALPAGATGFIPQLKKNLSFRTNVGLLNLGTAACQARISLHGAAGAQVGTTKTQTVSPGRYWQQDDIFTNVGAGSQDIAYARIVPVTSTCALWAYGSVVDEATGDPTTFPVQSGAQVAASFVASAAHTSGTGGTQWRTNYSVTNAGTVATTLALTYLPYAEGTLPVARAFVLQPGAIKEWQDVLVSLFNQSAGAASKGTLQVTAAQPLYVASRTYNQTAAGTYGQYYQPVRSLQALTSGQVGVIPQLKKSLAFRTNVGVMNVGGAVVTVAIKLWSAAGTQVGSTKTQSVAAGRYWQQDDIFTNAGAGNREIAYATVEVQTSGGRVWAYGSVVDNQTGDPTTIPVLVQ